MNDEPNNSVDAGGEDGPRGGERLAHARRERQITAVEIAKELHIDEPKVRALESNDFDALGAPVFAKGYLRKYAQLVGVAEADILADYYRMTRSSELPPVVKGRARSSKEVSPGPWIAALAIAAVAAGAYWWFAGSDTSTRMVEPPEPTEPEQAAIEPERADPVWSEPAQPEEMAPEVTEPQSVLAAPEQQQPVELSPAAVDETLADDLQLSVTMLFADECWTELNDADGRQLFFDMGRAGQSVSVRGKAPITALFGDVANVSIQVDGGDYPLPVARNANGTVRVTIVKP